MNNETIEAALRLGIALGKEEKAAPAAKAEEEEDYQTRLAAIFNAVSGFTEGLEALRDMKGSTFDFTQETKGSGGAADVISVFEFKTNIPLEDMPMYKGNPVYLTARINIPREQDSNVCSIMTSDYRGSAAVNGDYGSERLEIWDISRPQEVEKALTFVAKYAAKRGLIP